ncbi:MAG: hypothetical protein MHMPM18_004690 [Marteilia pararefringens]
MLSLNEYVDLITSGQSIDASINSVAQTAAIENRPSLMQIEDERRAQQSEVMARLNSLEEKVDRIEQLISSKLPAEKGKRTRKAKREKWQHETRNGKPVCPRCTKTL